MKTSKDFYSISNNSLLFSATQINQHKEWVAALWIIPSTTQKKGEWLVHTPPDNIENNSMNSCQISSVGKTAASLLYWQFWIISPFFPSSFNFSFVAFLASYAHHRSRDIYERLYRRNIKKMTEISLPKKVHIFGDWEGPLQGKDGMELIFNESYTDSNKRLQFNSSWGLKYRFGN